MSPMSWSPTCRSPACRGRRGKAPCTPANRQGARSDANALELFARIAAAGSFAQAARELGLTRAAISRRVAAIETAIGAMLFTRSTRALGLTPAGRRLAQRARAVHEAADQARRALRKDLREGLSGTLRVTSVPVFGQVALAPLLARFQALHPQLRLELRFTHRRMDLLRDDVDVAFRITDKPPPDCVATPVLAFAVRAYAAPRAGLPLAHPRALQGEPLLVLSGPADTLALQWRHDTRRGDPTTQDVEPAVLADDLGTLLALARHGRGIVFAPDLCAPEDLAAGRLIDALPGWRMRLPEGEQVMALTLAQGIAPEAARALVAFVRDALAAGPSAGRAPAR